MARNRFAASAAAALVLALATSGLVPALLPSAEPARRSAVADDVSAVMASVIFDVPQTGRLKLEDIQIEIVDPNPDIVIKNVEIRGGSTNSLSGPSNPAEGVAILDEAFDPSAGVRSVAYPRLKRDIDGAYLTYDATKAKYFVFITVVYCDSNDPVVAGEQRLRIDCPGHEDVTGEVATAIYMTTL